MSLDRTLLFRLATNDRFERLIRRIPPGEKLAWRSASRYVAGTTAASAIEIGKQFALNGVGSSIDHFGELIQDAAIANQVGNDYLGLAKEISSASDDVWLSIDLSHLGLDIDPQACAGRLAAIVRQLPTGRRIQVGAEDLRRAGLVIECVLAVAKEGCADNLGATIQANLRRSPADAERLAEAGVQVRLVKGAYIEPASGALRYGEETDEAYRRIAHRLAEIGANVSFATHDAVLRESLIAALGARPVEQLLGVRPDAVDDLLGRGIPIRVYVPFGDNWFRYWMRRVAEARGA